MNLLELTRYTNDEESAEAYLREQGILKTYEECPYCGSKRFNRVRRFKYKCYSCHREWGVRRGSILEGLRVPFTKFLMAIKLFELDTSVREASKQLGLAYNTVYNIHSLIRKAIPQLMRMPPHSPARLKWMNRPSEGEEKENADMGRQERFLYSASWNGEAK